MRHLSQIEDWIENIEGSDLKPKVKSQTITTLIDIWKFITYYDEKIILKSENTISIENEEIGVSIKDLTLDSSNIIQEVLFETEVELKKKGASFNGKYTIQFQKLEKNLCSEKISLLKEELLSAAKGEIICFEHINYIHKNPSDKIELFNSNLKITECRKTEIQRVLNKTTVVDSPKKQWLVLILDHLKNNCDAFLIHNYIKEIIFRSRFDKVFLFDFYKGQVIPLTVKI